MNSAAVQTVLGPDALLFRDPTGHKLLTFPSTVERDAWVTATGATTIPAGFVCYLTTPHQTCVWEGAAWKISAAYT